MKDTQAYLAVSYGSKTDAEMKVVLHKGTFSWLKRKGFLWPLCQRGEEMSPAKLFAFIRHKADEPRKVLFFLTDEEWGQMLALEERLYAEHAPE